MLRVRRNIYFILETNHFYCCIKSLSSVSDISRVAAVVQAVVQKDGKKYGRLGI